MKIPYRVLIINKTCVTPIIFPFWIMGSRHPWTIPPVAFRNLSSVIFIIMPFEPLMFCLDIFCISMPYSSIFTVNIGKDSGGPRNFRSDSYLVYFSGYSFSACLSSFPYSDVTVFINDAATLFLCKYPFNSLVQLSCLIPSIFIPLFHLI